MAAIPPTRRSAFFVVLLILILALWALNPFPSLAENPVPVQTFYVPLPEQQIRDAMLTLYAGTGSEIRSVVALVTLSDETIVYYDHWEDGGYEIDISTPRQAATQIWGDGNPANGAPPGYPADLLNSGDIIVLENTVAAGPRNPNDLRDPHDPTSYPFDGGDKIASSRAVAVTRAAWPVYPGPVLAGAVEVYPTADWGTSFRMPVGEDTPSDDMFEFVTLLVMAASNGTRVTIDYNLDGLTDITTTLNEGQSYLLPADVRPLAGTRVDTSQPAQVYLITGDIEATMETRWYAITPRPQWGFSYYSPVSTRTSNPDDRTDVFLYNPRTYDIQVSFDTLYGQSTFTVPARGVARRTIPDGSGAHFYTQSRDPFFAIAAIDANTPVPGIDDNLSFDWGFSLVPDQRLGSRALVSWAPGADMSSPVYQGPQQNGSPVWVTPTERTTVYVDLDADPTTGPRVDPNGHRYDMSFTLNALERQRVFDTADGDQTGMLLYTIDGVRLAVAWGEDPSTAGTGNPFLDLGTTVPPLPDFAAGKVATLAVDADGDGVPSPGDTLAYTVAIRNFSRAELKEVSIVDALPQHTTYVRGSTGFDNGMTLQPVPDDLFGTPFPLDEAGLALGTMPGEGIFQLTFQVVVDPFPPAGVDRVVNVAYVTAEGRTVAARVETPLQYAPGLTLSKTASEDVVYAGDTVTYRFAITNVGDTYLNGITLSDPALGLTLPGPALLAPGGSTVLSHQAQLSSTLHNTATVRANPCDAAGADLPGLGDVTASDDALVRVVAPAISLAKTANPRVILAGTVVRYDLTVTNPGNAPLSDVRLSDDRCSSPSFEGGDADGDGLLDPGETWRYTCSAAPRVDTVNRATVSAQPSDENGAPLPGIGRVSAEATATVDVVAPGIAMRKSATPTILYAGDTVTYRCQITNTGDVPLIDLALDDSQCPDMRYQSGDTDGDGRLDPGEAWILSCARPVMADTTNTAQVSAQPADGAGAPLLGIGRVSAQDSASVDVVAPAIEVDKEAAPTIIRPGETVTYTVRLSNPGDVPLADVLLVDDQCAAIRRVTVDTNGRLDPGETWTYLCNARPQTDVTNTAQASGQPADSSGRPLPGIGRVSDRDTAQVNVIAPHIVVSKRVGPSHARSVVVLPGQEVLYTILVTNTGDVPLGDIQVVDDRCAGLGYRQGDQGSDGLMGPGEVWEYTCAAQPNASVTNTVQASGQPSDAAGNALPGVGRVFDADSASVRVIRPGISIRKVASPTIVLAGETVAYTCTVTNTGDVPLLDIALSDDRCPAMALSSGDGNRNGRLDVGEVWVYTCRATLNADTTNIATVSGQPGDEQGHAFAGIARVSASDSAFVDVVAPAIAIAKEATPTVLYAGGRVTYSLTVENPGDLPLADVQLVDDRCVEVEYLGGDADADGLLDPGEIWRYRCLSSPQVDTTNTALVSGQPSNDSGTPLAGLGRVSAQDSAEVDVVAPGIALSKRASRPVVTVGNSVTYTYWLTNTGDTPLADLTLLDDHCAGVTYVRGDQDDNGLLDVGESWRYRCVASLNGDTLNIARAGGQPSDEAGRPLPGIGREVAEDSAFVRVIDPRIALSKEAQPLRFYAGEVVTYSYRLSNEGDVPLRDVTLVDDTCPGVEFLGGDDGNELLDPTEVWRYRCVQAIHIDTVNRADASGQPCEPSGEPFPGIEPVTATATAAVDVIEPECVEVFPREDFEEELSTRWYTSPRVTRSTTRAQSGRYSLRLGNGILDREKAVVAFILPDQTTLFTLNFFWSVDSTEYQRGQDQLVFFLQNANGDIIAEVARIDAMDRRIDWQLVSRDLTAWAGQAYSLLIECVTNSSRSSVFYLDNLELRLCSYALPYGCAVLDYYFHDEFYARQPEQWQYDLGSGSYRIQDSVITLRPEDDDVDRFPVFWRNGAFPLRENFLFEARFRFTNITPYGTTIGIGSKYYYGARYHEGSEPPPEIENILSIHHLDTDFWVALMGEKLWRGDLNDESWHTVQLIRREYTWILKVDGVQVGEVRSTLNPRSLYFGNPAIERWDGDWTHLDVDYLRVTACMGRGIVRVWQPLVINSR
ncbi:MAG: DUF11 domain-containing protein [Chloroflexi bacterium]|nr:DUF11 domain-containing protein [Chloroflexota bacterium]